MKKHLIVFLLFANIAVCATENFSFVGATVSTKASTFTNAGTNRDATFGLRYGLQNTQWRTMVSLEADYRGYKEATLETDYLFNTLDIESQKIKPYLGVSIGYYDHDNSDSQHALFAGHFGLIFNVSDKIDFDASVSYGEKRDNINLDHLVGLSFGVHYFF